VLFAPEPERSRLLRLEPSWPLSARRIRVHRNHAVEPTLTVARPYLQFAGIDPSWEVGDYDDSLSLTAVDPDVTPDAELVWLDYTRLTDRLSVDQIASWLGGRVAALRSLSPAPILVMDWDGQPEAAQEFAARFRESVAGIAEVRLGDRGEAFERLGERYFDPERATLTGSRMSREGAVETARLIGGRLLPSLLEPRLKAVVVDLDNTLYDGVLGEDGRESLVLTEGHAELQRTLLGLREMGIFLGLLSRNEPEDVRALFEARTDFPLRWEDFSTHSIGWHAKSAGLTAIAEALRIDPSALLFVDDNPGELFETAQHVPGLRCLHAQRDASVTVIALRYFPGLWAFGRTSEDVLRVQDIAANEAREQALVRARDDLGSYYRELEVQVSVAHNRPAELPRIAELSRKTNQFNLALRRYTEVDVQGMLVGGRHQLSTARLEDRLTDSGVIAMAIAERRQDTLAVLELCVSCRALGRQLEDLIVAQMLVSGPLAAGAREVVFPLVDGPRNGPARRWLAELIGQDIPPAPEPIELRIDMERLIELSENPNVSTELLR
jgi:FkbH-like protein